MLLIVETIETSKVVLVESPLPPPPVLDDLLLRLVNMVMVLQTLVSLPVFLHRPPADVVTLEEVIVVTWNNHTVNTSPEREAPTNLG